MIYNESYLLGKLAHKGNFSPSVVAHRTRLNDEIDVFGMFVQNEVRDLLGILRAPNYSLQRFG